MEFFLKKDVFKKIIMQHILFQLGFFTIFLLILYSFLGSFKDIYCVILPLILIFELIKQVIDFIKLKKQWYTYRILLNEEGIYKTQFEKDDVTIMREDIGRIIEIPKSGLSVQTHNTKNYIFIPRTLENYETCKDELARWYPIEESIISPSAITGEFSQFRLASHGRNEFFKSVKVVGIVFGGIISLAIILFLFLLYL